MDISLSIALDLLQKMLEFHPSDRITVEQALEHSYLKVIITHLSISLGLSVY